MGKDPQTALRLSELASRFQNIADTEIDAATSAKFINSQLKAFGDTKSLQKFTGDFEKAEHVIDATNEVANNFAVGTNDLQNALTKAGSAMSVAGNSFEQTIGMVTAGTEIMVGQPAKVGRGLRSIAINISKLAQENEYFEAANGKVKVALQDSNGEMRSTYDIMNDLGKVWGNLNETEQTSIATTLAGKTQFEVFANLMKNWGSAVEATNKAMNSQGSSIRENEKYLDSIEGKIQAFQSAWEQLSYHIISSDLIKNVVSLGTKIITVIDNIVQGIGVLPTVLGLVAGAFGALKLAKTVEGFFSLGKAVGEVAEAATEAGGAGGIGSLVGSLGKLGSALLPLAPALIALGGAFIYANHQYKNSFKGKLEEYKELGNQIEDVQSQIEALEGKESELTSEEQSRLSILKMQLEILKQQEALKSKQLTNAFNQDAKEKMHGKTHMVQGEAVTEREDLAGDKYIKAAEKRFELQKKIKHLEDEQRMHPLTVEQTKQLEDYNKELDKVYTNEYEALDKVLEEQEALANVDYSKLNADAKAWYDNTHSAYLQASSDIEEVRKAVGQAIETFGSAQFDAWDIDISSLKSADELATKIKEKIEAMGDDEEITFRAKSDDGSFTEVTKKKSELTKEDIDAIINFNQKGLEGVESKANNTARDRDSVVKVAQKGAETVSKVVDTAAKDRDTTVNVGQKGAGDVQKTINGIKGKDVHINIFKTIWESIKKKAKGKRKGEEGGMSWLGDEGSRANPKPELVVGEDGAYLAGTGGWELRNLKASDTVYTASQTKRLLSDGDFDIASVELPRYKKGKNSKKAKARKIAQKKATNANVKKAQQKVKNAKSKKAKEKAKKNFEKLKKMREKPRSDFDKKLEELQHKAKVNHWTDAKYQAEYKKLYDRYKAYLSTDQSNDYTEAREDYENERDKEKFEKLADDILSYDDLKSFKTKVNANNNLSADEKAELIQDAGHKYYSNEFDRRLGNLGVRGGAKLANYLADVKNNKYLSVAEKEEYARKGYEVVAKYNLEEYKNGTKTRGETLKSIKDYYKEVGKYDETYYKMLDELREADQQKEVERLKKLEEQQENKLTLAQKYLNKELSAIEKQIEAEKEQEENEKKLVELQNELNKAKSQTIKIYREGQGFVYEQDAEAIKNAQEALDEYTSSQTKSALEKRAEEIRAILDLFDEMEENSAIHELELALGVNGLSSLTGGNLGSDIGKWSSWIKGVIASQVAYADLGKIIGDLSGADIDKWLGDVLGGGNHEVSSSVISQYLTKHSFASGTLSASGGLSILGEHGAELAWLGKGDSVYSNAISRNLMEWGKYNPAQVLSHNNSTASQVFNFDKIVLPNVRNAHDFYMELQKLPNIAIQQSIRRY